ncbi:MAG: patatin-like phospholipase family protein [Bacteroidales bacterium]|nr:patatin-like phospholipase family protein [Bacteroidales bacterium]
MKKIILLLSALLLAGAPVVAQSVKEPESSSFGLDEKDAAAVRKIRYRMAQIRKSRPTVALVLSGGGAKGAATVGVLKYLEQYDLPVDMVVGTSIGGLVGGMYALGYKADYLDSLFRNMDWGVALSDEVDKSYIPYSRIRYKEKYLLSFPFYYKQDDYKNFIRGDMPFAAGRSRELHLGAEEGEDISSLARGNLMGSLPSGFVFGQNVNQIITSRTVGYSDSTDFFKMPIPFACVATDMASGRAKIWHEGSLNLALRSTMSIPGLFAPVRTGGMVLVDGGMRNNFPVNIARQMGADIIIGIDLSDSTPGADEIQNLGDILMSTMNLFDDDAFNLNVRNVDVHIHPNLKGYNMLSFNRTAVDTMYARGYKAAQEMKPQLDAVRHRLGKARFRYNAPPAVDLGQAPVIIEDIDIVGVNEKEAEYLRSKMYIKPGSIVDKKLIEQEIAAIFGKGSYDYVTYELRGKKEPYRLRILCKRGPMHQIGFGARIDSQDIVSLLLNVGLNTNAMQGHSLDLTARISLNPYLDVRYSYNAPKFSTFNVRATLQYSGSTTFLAGQKDYVNLAMLQSAQELFFSNMHWSSFDVKVGLRNQLTTLYNIATSSESGIDYTYRSSQVLNYPGFFADGRIETLDNGYFPTRGISAGIRGELTSDILFAGASSATLYGIVGMDGMFPFSLGRLSFIPQLNARLVFGNNPAAPITNVLGGDMRGRYLEQQIPFVGLNDMAIMRNHLLVGRLDARYKLFKNQYVSLMGNVAYDFSSFKTIGEGRLFTGVGLGYAYDSIAGPLKAQVHWSSVTKRVGLYLSFGYNF